MGKVILWSRNLNSPRLWTPKQAFSCWQSAEQFLKDNPCNPEYERILLADGEVPMSRSKGKKNRYDQGA